MVWLAHVEGERLRAVKAGWRIAALVACCSAGAVMASQRPAPAPGKPAQENQYKAAPDKNKTESKQQAPAPESSGVDKGRSTLATSRPKDERNNRSKEPPRDWWAIVASVLNLIFSGCLVALMWRQWRAMQEQARYMKDGLTETSKAADAATAGAAAAKVSADAAKASAEATVENNMIASRSLELGRRAWIVATQVKPEPMQLVVGGKVSVAITIINVGSTPATNVINRGALDVISGSEIPDLIQLTPGDLIASSSVIGGGQRMETVLSRPENFSEEEVARVESGDATLLVYLQCEYRDVFRKSRWTVACWHYDRKNRRWKNAPKNNQLDTVAG